MGYSSIDATTSATLLKHVTATIMPKKPRPQTGSTMMLSDISEKDRRGRSEQAEKLGALFASCGFGAPKVEPETRVSWY